MRNSLRLPLARECPLTNTHYRWVAQLWSTEECFIHAAKETASWENKNTADCFRTCPAAIARKGRIFSGFVRTRHWISPQLYWPVGARREESLAERLVQSVSNSEPTSIPVLTFGREALGLVEIATSLYPLRITSPHAQSARHTLCTSLTSRPANRAFSDLPTDSQGRGED